MKIFRVIGLTLAIIMLKFLMPRVFAGIEETLLAFFDTLQHILVLNPNWLPANVPSVPGI